MAHNKRMNASRVLKDIQQVTRTFPTIYVEIKRAARTYTALKGQTLNLSTATIVFKGEVLHADTAAAGSLFRYPLGEVRIEQDDHLLINGDRDIRQGDFVQMPDGRLCVIKSTHNIWGVWVAAALQQYQQ